jgi:hypothetical protein
MPAPAAVRRFIAHRIGRTIYTLWSPGAGGAAPTSYVLDVTGAFVGAFEFTTRAVSGAVGPGEYRLTVRARNPCGTSAATAQQVVAVP